MSFKRKEIESMLSKEIIRDLEEVTGFLRAIGQDGIASVTKNALDTINILTKYLAIEREERLRVLKTVEKIKAAYIANGGDADCFDAMDQDDWAEAFSCWFAAMDQKSKSEVAGEKEDGKSVEPVEIRITGVGDDLLKDVLMVLLERG